jgi:hypothetical protein
MSFFKKPLPLPQHGKSLLSWWNNVKNYYLCWPHFESVYTRDFERQIVPLLKKQDELRLEAKLKIRNLAIDWLNAHLEHNKKSHRMIQVHQFIKFLDKEILEEKNDHKEFDSYRDLKMFKVVENDWHEQPWTHGPDYFRKLYDWWKNISRLSWYQFRSTETKKLDQKIEWYFTNIFINEEKALKDIEQQIESWIENRQGKSERMPAVLLLKEHLNKAIEEVEYNKEKQRSFFTPGYNYIAFITYLISDLFTEFEFVSELLCF